MINIGRYQFCFLDLITDNSGRISSSKFWFNVANIIMSKIMLQQVSVDWTLLSAYGAVVGGSHVAALFIKLRYGVKDANISNIDTIPEK